ncbi:aspartyl/asparaginyl beta-hydroxylase domain-containing protein [Rhodanobacter sp. PCA2]|uniref:aspartyl/asparaginyl beta-hydroxylase domain-containing protein n=1 Tax=Rhodanobacter sp. PCA2 TaxID=2006117 RepID=UPI0015E74951|nr:aspartyl/asparaginyl beta-hydroxylase domain-containing protein [Rhodanobacter sp. PCA2]MBA2080168.1 aspartyl beta-hydroxylase [Rhodanobacter sp. PCA2]
MDTESQGHVVALREKALAGLRQGDASLAEQCFVQLLETMPDDVDALQFVAGRHFQRGDGVRAVALLQHAALTAPGNADIMHQLGTVQMANGDLQGAASSLGRCLELQPGHFLARLRLGLAMEQLGRSHEALVAYFAAINTAQAQGRWLSDATTAPGIRVAVQHAMRHVDAGRHALFDGLLEPLRERYGRGEMRRVEECLAIYLHERPANLPDPRQQPKFLYFPGIPSRTYYPRQRFPEFEALEAATAAIRDELCAVLDRPEGLEAFLRADTQEQLDSMLHGAGAQRAAWDAYFFYRHGQRYDAHCEACPRTTAMIERMPLSRIRDHGPETLFSVLRPGTHILPHRGVTNTRLVTHLPLIVPADCALNVGGEIHEWQEGRCVTFDDTFEHEAWNRSDSTRVVLIMDCWNPDLTEAEREAVAVLVAGIGDFNRSCELPGE